MRPEGRADLGTQSNQPEEFFPYRNASRAEISNVLEGVRGLVSRLAHEMNRWGFVEDDLEDMIQNCLVHLWMRSLPKFDTRCRSKVSTFLHTCAFQFFRTNMPREYKRSRRRERTCPTEVLDIVMCDGGRLDQSIEELANDILSDPAQFLTEAQARVLSVVTEHPRLPKTEIARMLGYAFPASLSQMLKRIRADLTDLDIENYA